VNLFIDPNNGVDAPGCGLDNTTACSSIAGALNENNLANVNVSKIDAVGRDDVLSLVTKTLKRTVPLTL